MGAPVFVPCFLVVTQIKRALFTIADCINSIHLNSSRDKIWRKVKKLGRPPKEPLFDGRRL
jgi:hypothetical protein